MNKRLLFILLFTIFSLQLEGQSSFNTGYIFTETDTIYGLIGNMDYATNAQYCTYKKTTKDSIIRYSPRKISGYRFQNGKYYIAKTITIDHKTIRVFLEFLIDGLIDIYFYQDQEGKNHYFISKDGSKLRELIFEKGITEIDGKKILYENKKYHGLLEYYLADCPAVIPDIQKLREPNHKALIKLAKKYHRLVCNSNACISYEKKMIKKIKLMVNSGVNTFFSNISDIEQRTFPTYGFTLLFQSTRRRENLFLGIGFYQEGRIDNFDRYFRIPLSINYINPKPGLSPIAAYEFDLNRAGGTQAMKLGLKYQADKFSILLLAEVKTWVIFAPHAAAQSLGILLDLN